jgi:hypothetical protein
MMRVKRLYYYLLDTIWIRLLGGGRIRKEKKEREERAISTILSYLPSGEPYVIDGKWNWYKEERGEHFPITLLLPDLPLAIQVFGPEVGTWDLCRIYCKDKKHWEYVNKAAANFIAVTAKISIPTVSIYWNEPIDPINLKLRIPGLEERTE